MNTELLKTFLTLAEVKNFRKTAQILFISPSAVTCRIHELEKETGQALFERKNKTLILTTFGYQMIPYARRMLELEKDIKKLNSSNKFHDVLKIGSCDSIYEHYVHPHIPDFLRKNPDISLNIINRSSSDLLNALHDEEIDLALDFLPSSNSSHENYQLSMDPILLVTADPDSPYKAGITLDELHTLPIYTATDFFTLTRELSQWYKSVFPPDFPFRVQIDLLYRMCSLLRNDKTGYGFVPQSFVDDALKQHQLISIPLLFQPSPTVDVYLVVKKSSLPLYRVKCFLDQVCPTR